METLKKQYQWLAEKANAFQSLALFLIRLYWGWAFFIAGFGKVLNPQDIFEFFESLKIPFPMLSVYLAGYIECIGGLLLLVGFLSRLVSIPLAFTMLVAFVTAHRGALKEVFSNPDAVLAQSPFLFLYACLIIIVFGPGRYSLDRFIFKDKKY